MQCYMLRAAVFMGEQACPYWEEYDGNDYTASHLILYVDGEPAASMRVRWFAGFAKLERAIILKRYRSYGLFIAVRALGQGILPQEGLSQGLPARPEAAVADLRAATASARSTTRSSTSPTMNTAPSSATSKSARTTRPGVHRSRWC